MSFVTPITIQSLFGQDRKIGDIAVDVILNENASDILSTPKHPVHTGAPITDHAFKEASVLTMEIRFKDNLLRSLSKIYQDLLDLQFPAELIDITTPKRVYKDMLINVLNQTTDKFTEKVLAINITFGQVLLADIASIQVAPLSQQAQPNRTAGNLNAGRKSALLIGKEAVAGLFQ